MLIKMLQAEETLQRRLLHFLHIGKTHVIGDQQQDLLRLVIGKSQTETNLFSNANPNVRVTVEAYAVWRHAKSGWLANVVQ